jgi:hypothetical protein
MQLSTAGVWCEAQPSGCEAAVNGAVPEPAGRERLAHQRGITNNCNAADDHMAHVC